MAPVVFWNAQRILELQDGPVNLRITSRTHGDIDTAAAEAAAEAAMGALRDLAPLRTLLSGPACRLTPEPAWPRVLRLMVEAAAATGDETLTPMAAVAGSIGQVALEAGLAAGVGTMVVENGGDIALAVEPGDRVRVGIARGIDDRRPSHRVTLDIGCGVGGVGTSGLGGRSFTRGVAAVAVAFSPTAATADACATVLANATFVAHPAVEQERAGLLDSATDIPELWVTTRVAPLPDERVVQALRQARRTAGGLFRLGLLRGAFVAVQERTLVMPGTLAEPLGVAL